MRALWWGWVSDNVYRKRSCEYCTSIYSCFYFQVLPFVDTMLFSLIILKGLCDSHGLVWRCHPTQLYAVEITVSANMVGRYHLLLFKLISVAHFTLCRLMVQKFVRVLFWNSFPLLIVLALLRLSSLWKLDNQVSNFNTIHSFGYCRWFAVFWSLKHLESTSWMRMSFAVLLTSWCTSI